MRQTQTSCCVSTPSIRWRLSVSRHLFVLALTEVGGATAPPHCIDTRHKELSYIFFWMLHFLRLSTPRYLSLFFCVAVLSSPLVSSLVPASCVLSFFLSPYCCACLSLPLHLRCLHLSASLLRCADFPNQIKSNQTCAINTCADFPNQIKHVQ